MKFKVDDKVVAIRDGNGLSYCYKIGWKGTVKDDLGGLTIEFDNGKYYNGCDSLNFKKLEEEMKFKAGDTVRITKLLENDSRVQFRKKIGTIKGNIGTKGYCYTIDFEGNGKTCGWCFDEVELERVENMFTKADLKTGMLVQMNNNEWRMVVLGANDSNLVADMFIEIKDNFTYLDFKDYDDNLVYCDNLQSPYTIKKVAKTHYFGWNIRDIKKGVNPEQFDWFDVIW